MLEITGSYKGKTFKKDEPLSPLEIAKHFDIPVPSETRPAFIRVAKNRTMIDALGQKRMPKNTQLPASFNVSTYDGTFNVRYYTSSNPSENGITMNYAPHRVVLAGEIEVFGKDRLEQYVYWMLNPNNASSQFAKPDAEHLVERYDPEAESDAIMVREMFKADLLIKISTADPRELRVKAAGMNIKGQVIGIDSTISDSQIRLVLIRLAQEYPQDFAEQWDADNTQFYGMINVCVAQGFIVRRTAASASGQFAYFWADTNEKICDIGRTEDPLTALRAAIGTQYASASNRMVDALGGKAALPGFAAPTIDIRKAKEATPDEMTAEQLVGGVNARNIVVFDLLKKQVRWMSTDGERYEGNPLMTTTSSKNWQDELAAFIETPEGEDIKKTLVKRLKSAFKKED